MMPRSMVAAEVVLPAAARLQGTVTEADWQLLAIVRKRRWAVVWWWGVRQMGGNNIGTCYHCGGYIATWRRFRAPSAQNLGAIAAHRAVVLRGLGLDPGNDAAGTPPTAVAVTEGSPE